jgi:hypothetical protein
MPGDRSPRDRRRINTGEEHEIEYWARVLGVSKQELVEAVSKVGDSFDAVEAELRNSQGRRT